MKKILVGILAILYIVISSGVAMEIHYCMGKQAGVDFYTAKEDKCGKCGMKEKKSGCCNDEHKFFKLEDSHKQVSNDIIFYGGEIAVLTDYPVYDWQLSAHVTVDHINNHSPPDYSGPSACIMHCVFLI